MLRVGLHENIFILFLLAIKTAGSAQKLRVGRVSGKTAIFCLRLMLLFSKFCTCLCIFQNSMEVTNLNQGIVPQSRLASDLIVMP